MPPRKQPKSLQELSLKTVGSFVVKVFLAIERKSKNWSSQACKNKLEVVKRYLFQIQHLSDDLTKTVFDFVCNSAPYEERCKINLHLDGQQSPPRYQVLDVLLCNKLRKLDVRKLDEYCRKDSVFWKSQLWKLTNVVELNLQNLRMTEELFQVIGDKCLRVRKIALTSDLTYTTSESLKHLLNCKELRDVTVRFVNWNENRKSEYIRMFVTSLPNVEYFHDWVEADREACQTKTVLSIVTPVTSMRRVRVMESKSAELAVLLGLCPNLTDIRLKVARNEDQNKVIKVLTESLLKLDALALYDLSFSHDMIQSVTSTFKNLLCLHISVRMGERISVTDIRTIGVNCPRLEKLWIEEKQMKNNEEEEHNEEDENTVSTPCMFVGLKLLHLCSSVKRKQRILPVILRHANSLADLTLSGVMSRPADNSVDILSEILDTNALTRLEKLVVNVESGRGEPQLTPLRVTSIERLLNGCPKLTKLRLVNPMDSAGSRYLSEQECTMKRENFDFSLDFDSFIMAR